MADTTLSIHRILCPTDFSDSAAAAFAESMRLARWFGAKVTVLHVVPFVVPIAGDAGYVPVGDLNDNDVRKDGLERIRRFVDESALTTGIPIEAVCRQGDACHEIGEVARETGADVIVMGTHGRSGFKRLVLGSVTEAVLNSAPALVLTVHRDLPRRKGLFRRILCASDVSERTTRTMAVATAFADESAKLLTVLNVIEDGRESATGDLERAALAGLRSLIPDEARDSYRIEEHVAFGEADREILRLASEEDADLIVMGTHGRAGLGALFGSTVRGVVRDAKCPVLLVPTGQAWPATTLTKTQNAEPVAPRL